MERVKVFFSSNDPDRLEAEVNEWFRKSPKKQVTTHHAGGGWIVLFYKIAKQKSKVKTKKTKN